MRPFGAWFGRLAMAGVCLAGAGCGGGDVPDPDSDRRAASSEPPQRIVDKSAAAEAPVPEAEAKAEPTALASNGPEKAAPAAKSEAVETEKSAPALKGDSSGTEEMLRAAATPGATSPASETPGGSGSAPANSGSAAAIEPQPAAGGSGSAGGIVAAPQPGAGRMGMMRPGSAGGGAPAQPGMAPSAPGMAPPPPGAIVNGGNADSTNLNDQAAAGGRFRQAGGGSGGMPQAPGMPGGGPGGFGGGSGSDASAAVDPKAFQTPQGAVTAFLAALKSKNKVRLAQTTAKRAPTEAAEKHRKIFSEIIDESISDEDVDEMAKALDGFQVISVLPAKSTRKIDVVVSKMSGRDRLQRTIVTRQEVEGWKVLDIEAMYDFKPGLPPMMRGRGTGRRR